MNPFAGALTGRKVFAILAMFFFVMLAANLALVFSAFRSWTGLSTGQAYDRGRAYNTTLEAARVQEALGWRGEIRFSAERGLLELELRDRAGGLIEGAEVKALFVRPVQRGHDIALSLEAASPGRYAATVRPTLPGQWEARVEAKTAEGEWRGRARGKLTRAAAP